MSIYEPYTYIIGWTKLNLWYYGCRYSFRNKANPKDFWVTYFSSSKKVKHLRMTEGEPDVLMVRKTFKASSETPDDEEVQSLIDSVLSWERKFLIKIDALNNNLWLNENIGGIISRNGSKKAGNIHANKLKSDAKYRKKFSEIRQKQGATRFFTKEEIKRGCKCAALPENIEKRKLTYQKIGHQSGEKNSQYGKMWIYNDMEKRSIKIDKNDQIPSGWYKGRKIKFD